MIRLHFLGDLISNPNDPDPVRNMPHVHRHFIKYSRGEFVGPAIKVKITAKNITVNASFEYEDLNLWLGGHALGENTVKITGNIISGSNFSGMLENLGLNWKVVKSTGKTKNYKCTIKPADNVTLSGTDLKKLAEVLGSVCYIMLSFKTTAEKGNISLTTKKNPPRPRQNTKTGVDAKKEEENALKFSILRTPKDKELLDILIKEAFPDFKELIPTNPKEILLKNTYKITDLIIPKDKSKSSAAIRKLTIRVGKLIRLIKINGKEYTNTVEFAA